MNSKTFKMNQELSQPCGYRLERLNQSNLNLDLNNFLNMSRFDSIVISWTRGTKFPKEHIDISMIGYDFDMISDKYVPFNETIPYYFNTIDFRGDVTDNIHIKYTVLDETIPHTVFVRFNGLDYLVNSNKEVDFVRNDTKNKIIKFDNQFIIDKFGYDNHKMFYGVQNEHFSDYINLNTLNLCRIGDCELCCENVCIKEIIINHFQTYHYPERIRAFSGYW